MGTILKGSTTAVCLLAAALFGCGPKAWSLAQSSDPVELLIEGRSVDSTVVAASAYTTTPSPGGTRGEYAEQLARKVREHLEGVPLVADGRLAALAARVAQVTHRRRAFPDTLEVDALAREEGLVGPCPFVLLVPYADGEWAELPELLSAAPTNAHFTHLGVAVLRAPGVVQGALALGAQHLELEPVPRRVGVNEKLSFKGKIAAHYRPAKWVWTLPDGSTRTLVEGGSNAIALTTEPLGPGVHRFEAFGIGPTGLEVLANFPISVGAASPVPDVFEPAPNESDPAAALLELINRARARAGLRALSRTPVLDRIAQAHSTDMVENHFVGHQSPQTGEPENRVQASGLRVLLFGENVAKAASASLAHRMLMESPGHRQNILDPRYTHVGIGTIARLDERPPSITVTEVFSRFPGPLADPAAFATQLFEQTNQARAQKNLPAVSRKRIIDTAASKIAARLAASPSVKPVDLKSLVRTSDISAFPGRTIGLLALFPAVPEDIGSVPNLLEPDLRSLGIGVVQVEPTTDTPRTNVVVFVFLK